MDHYIIRDAGLYREIAEYKHVPSEESFLGFFLERQYMGEEHLSDFHGDVWFYDSHKDYIARFSNGVLDWIRAIEEKPEGK
jgi:hypothetical protein